MTAFWLMQDVAAGDAVVPVLSQRLDLRPDAEKKWDASIADVRKVLDSTASELWKYFPEHKLPPILIAPKGGPISLYDRGPHGEIQVRLDTGGMHWAQYAFQFAHEFCHILSGFRPHENPHHWFEESLCELASLFALRRMAETWSVTPPYPNWKSFAPHLKEYADERIDKAKLPTGQKFADWFSENEAAMRANSIDRARNCVVAVELLSLFEAEPKMWEAVSSLNNEKVTKLFSFKQYLEAWRRNSAEKHRAFIDKLAEHFSIELER